MCYLLAKHQLDVFVVLWKNGEGVQPQLKIRGELCSTGHNLKGVDPVWCNPNYNSILYPLITSYEQCYILSLECLQDR